MKLTKLDLIIEIRKYDKFNHYSDCKLFSMLKEDLEQLLEKEKKYIIDIIEIIQRNGKWLRIKYDIDHDLFYADVEESKKQYQLIGVVKDIYENYYKGIIELA